MGKKKDKKKDAVPPQVETAAVPAAQPAASDPAPEEASGIPEASSVVPAAPAKAAVAVDFRRPSFLRRWGPDIAKAAAALFVLAAAVAIWFQPPLLKSGFPYLSYTFQNRPFTDAELYRPLAMPTRYYIKLPHELALRYQWFAVDRRREVAALAKAPVRSFFGLPAIRRGDALGLDLEFTKLDNSEWQVAFNPDSIVFSNAVLSVRLDAKAPERK